MFTETVIPPKGIVLLSQKQIPICEQPDIATSHDDYYAYTRGQIDINPFKNHLLSLPKEIWEDKNQQGNVKLIRPAHDNWGIQKIIFTFCDDFLQKVFDLPWSKLQEWRQFLLPIYECVGIHESQVVRCLLASMPAGVSIPIHHDTGFWVKQTHRLHVPIITGEGVDFLVGPTDDRMKKYTLNEGCIVELNNQAKHAVFNNMPTGRARVHLIFDYVDRGYVLPRRVLLKPGEIVHQTRRSIDLASDAGQRQTPSFIIIGAQKSGTTSLYEYLCNHPLVIPGGRRETHFFDWRWNPKLVTPEAQLDYYLKFYDKKTIEKNPSLMSGESTPSYLLHSDVVIPRLLSVCPWVKILIMLRDPVERAYSQYQMCVDPVGTNEQLQTRGMSSYVNKSFAQVVAEEIERLRILGINETSSYQEFRDKVLSNRPMTHGGHSILIRGLYALQLEPWLEIMKNTKKETTDDDDDDDDDDVTVEKEKDTTTGKSSAADIDANADIESDEKHTNNINNNNSSSSNTTTTTLSTISSITTAASPPVAAAGVEVKVTSSHHHPNHHNQSLDMKIVSISQLKGSLSSVQNTMNDIYSFVGLPPHILETHEITPKNTRDYTPMNDDVKILLQNFYFPYNERLKLLLKKYDIDLPPW